MQGLEFKLGITTQLFLKYTNERFDWIFYVCMLGWKFILFFSVQIMFLSDPLLQKYWLEKSKIELMISVQMVNVFDSEYIKN